MSVLKKRSISISGHQTSITLEDEFWLSLKEIAERQKVSTRKLIEKIDAERQTDNLSSAIRIYVLTHYKKKS